MRIAYAAALAALLSSAAVFASSPKASHVAKKNAAIASIEAQSSEMTAMSDAIWRYAETALQETRSSKTLADYAEAKGFRVTRGVAEMPTAFVAEYGSGPPVIAILGEYDALPGISQKAQPKQEPLDLGAAGHGCGHNLFGVASLAAATAIREQIARGALKGTIRFYGTPAEEAVGGKLYMLRAGLFKDVDVAVAWHPSDETTADTKSSQAMVDLMVEFKGRAAHAAFDPWNGRSAADGVELFTHAVNMMREHVRPTVRMHYVIAEAGNVPNVVPDHAKVWIWLRDNEVEGVEDLLARVRKIAQGASLAADVESTIRIQSGDWNTLVNMTGERIAHANMQWLGPLKFTAEEQAFAREIQKTTGVPEKGLLDTVRPFDENPGPPEGGSTDVADVSWNVPTIHLSVTTAPFAAPWHAWPVVACGGMSIGHRGMVWAAKALATTMVDLFEDPGARAAIRREFDEKAAGKVYRPFIPDGPPPVKR